MASHDARKNHKDATPLNGTGLFLVPAPEKGPVGFKVVAVPDLEYHDCVQRGQHCVAFKWVAPSVMSHADILKAQALGTYCGSSCSYFQPVCAPGCICNHVTGNCER